MCFVCQPFATWMLPVANYIHLCPSDDHTGRIYNAKYSNIAPVSSQCYSMFLKGSHTSCSSKVGKPRCVIREEYDHNVFIWCSEITFNFKSISQNISCIKLEFLWSFKCFQTGKCCIAEVLKLWFIFEALISRRVFIGNPLKQQSQWSSFIYSFSPAKVYTNKFYTSWIFAGLLLMDAVLLCSEIIKDKFIRKAFQLKVIHSMVIFLKQCSIFWCMAYRKFCGHKSHLSQERAIIQDQTNCLFV